MRKLKFKDKTPHFIKKMVASVTKGMKDSIKHAIEYELTGMTILEIEDEFPICYVTEEGIDFSVFGERSPISSITVTWADFIDGIFNSNDPFEQIAILNKVISNAEKAFDLPNYPAKSAQDLRIEDLERENEAAFQRIQELSRALVDLGFDPTQLP